MLDELLEGYNDGRRKSLFCAAAYLLELPALRGVLERLRADPTLSEAPAAQRGRACRAAPAGRGRWLRRPPQAEQEAAQRKRPAKLMRIADFFDLQTVI